MNLDFVNNLLSDDLTINDTKIISKYKDIMLKERAKILQDYAESTREGHSYEIKDKDNGRVWLYDLNDTTGGGIEEFEEIEFPKDLYEMAKNGDKFLYKNGLYTKNHESN